MNIACRPILLVSLLVCYIYASAQPASVLFDHFTSVDGLSNNDVKTIYKDHRGFIWIGTEYGLNRFDGKNFKVYRHSETDSNSLLNNVINDILEDEWGYLWISTAGGLCQYNPLTDEFSEIKFPKGNTYNHTGNPGINCVIQNKSDRSLWVCTGVGLFRVNVKKNTLEPAPDNNRRRVLSGPVSCAVVTAADDIWLGTYNGLYLYHPSTGQYQKFINPVEKELPFDLLITCIYPDRNGLLWAGTWGVGLHCFDTHTNTWTDFYLTEPNSGIQGGANVILDIKKTDIPGQENILWVASETSSLQAFNINTKQFHSYSATHRDERTGVFEAARNLYYAPAEGLWIASTSGLYRYDPNRQLFNEYAFKYPFKTGCLTFPIAVYTEPQDTSGNTLWVSTYTCGLYKYNLSTKQMQPVDDWLRQQLPIDIMITAVFRDSRNMLWLGSSNKGMFCVDEAQKKVYSLKNPQNGFPALSRPEVNVLKEDRQGAIWIGTDSGVYVLDNTRRNLQPVILDATDNLKEKLSVYCYDICFDKSGNTWISLCNDGIKLPVIGKIKPGSFSAQAYYNEPGKPGSFPERIEIRRITCDNNNTLWCSSRNGLINWKADEENIRFTRFTEADGLNASRVYRVINDNSGRTWAATVGGLSVYIPNEKKFRNFINVQYGLDKENTHLLFYNPVQDEILLGYNSKLYGLKTAKIATPLPPPNIEITDFKVDNQTFFINTKKVSNGAFVKLDPQQNMITIEFAALSYTNAQQNRYAYKLQGVDNDWVYTTNNTVSYKLIDGNYDFFVKASNADGTWSEEIAKLTILIRPPFYKTWWFLLLCLVAAGSIVFFIVRIRIQRLKAIYQVRNLIARDLHDELGSTLTSINILSQVSKNNMQKDQQKTTTLLEKITEQSQQMQQDMSDIVWAIRPDNDKVENMVVRMREFLGHTLEPKNIAIDFNVDEKVLKESLSMQQRRDVMLILKEAINNTAKHAKCKRVGVMLSKQNGTLQLIVTDDGIGFNKDAITSSSGLKNMISRAESMKGTIDIQSEAGKGTRIQLQVPATS